MLPARLLIGLITLSLSACTVSPFAAQSGQTAPAFVPFPGQGQYVRPARLDPVPVPFSPVLDTCGAQVLRPLIGASEGSVYIPALPGEKRILRPVFFEDFENEFLGGELVRPPLVEVETYLPGQQVYAPLTRAFTEPDRLGAFDPDRITIELDRNGDIQDIRCG